MIRPTDQRSKRFNIQRTPFNICHEQLNTMRKQGIAKKTQHIYTSAFALIPCPFASDKKMNYFTWRKEQFNAAFFKQFNTAFFKQFNVAFCMCYVLLHRMRSSNKNQLNYFKWKARDTSHLELFYMEKGTELSEFGLHQYNIRSNVLHNRSSHQHSSQFLTATVFFTIATILNSFWI